MPFKCPPHYWALGNHSHLSPHYDAPGCLTATSVKYKSIIFLAFYQFYGFPQQLNVSTNLSKGLFRAWAKQN